jgi:hypothetical protein
MNRVLRHPVNPVHPCFKVVVKLARDISNGWTGWTGFFVILLILSIPVSRL